MMLRWLKRRKRDAVRARPFPAAWEEILLREAPYCSILPEASGRELRENVKILLEEKRFEGCGGLEVDDAIRVTIAAHASVLLLNRETDYYPQLESILVYPGAYIARGERHVGEFLVEEGDDVREGESWYRGALVLSWDDVRRGAQDIRDGENVVFHEFAHQLDDESGDADGTPVLESRSQLRKWVAVFQSEFEALQEADDRGKLTLIDPYGAESPSEFFAVVTECFFEKPIQLSERHPELYALLRSYYRQDPGTYDWGARPAASRDADQGRRRSRPNRPNRRRRN